MGVKSREEEGVVLFIVHSHQEASHALRLFVPVIQPISRFVERSTSSPHSLASTLSPPLTLWAPYHIHTLFPGFKVKSSAAPLSLILPRSPSGVPPLQSSHVLPLVPKSSLMSCSSHPPSLINSRFQAPLHYVRFGYFIFYFALKHLFVCWRYSLFVCSLSPN